MKKKLEIPGDLNYVQLDLTGYLDRTLDDEVENDGQGGWTDQGPESDIRELKLGAGIHTLAGVPFKIERPESCFALASRYRKGGYEELEIPVNRKATALFWLQSCAYTSKQQHYSVLVNYDDRTQSEIAMVGDINLRDWGHSNPKEIFNNEVDTITECALTVPQKRFGKASVYRTAWINPYPDKTIVSITFKSMKKGVPVILAVTLGTPEEEFSQLPEAQKIKLHTETIRQALALQKAGKYHEAILFYEKALRIMPERLSAYRDIGSCYEALGDYRNAVRTYERSLKADINQPDILGLLNKAGRQL